MISEIKKWGNSAAVRLPGKLLAAAGLEADSAVSITAEAGRIVIDRVKPAPKGQSVKSIKGIVPYSGPVVSVEEMNDAIKAKGGAK